MTEKSENRFSGAVGILFGLFLAGIAYAVSSLPPALPVATLLVGVMLMFAGLYMTISGKNPI